MPMPVSLLVAIIHEPLLQVSTESALRLCGRTAPTLECFPPRLVHVHPDHELAFLLVDADIVVVC